MKCVFQSEAAENWTTGLGEYYTVKYSKYLVHNYVHDYTYIETTHISNTSVVHLHVPSYIPYIPNTENLRLRAMFVFFGRHVDMLVTLPWEHRNMAHRRRQTSWTCDQPQAVGLNEPSSLLIYVEQQL